PMFAAEPNAERGRIALTTRTFTPAVWTLKGYENAWKQWQLPLKEAPREYIPTFADRYGLHPAPFENDGLPMGLRLTDSLLLGKAVAYNCMLCHAGSILGKSYIGLGNSSLDIQALFEDLGKESGTVIKTPFPFTNVRGTTE